MNTKKYKITLTTEEKELAKQILSDGIEDASVLTRAKILLLSDTSTVPEKSIVEIAEEAGTSRQTVIKIRSICFERGFQIALRELDRSGYKSYAVNDSELLKRIQEIISEPPVSGRSKWSLRSVCNECVSRGYVKHIVPSTIMKILKKNNIQL